MIGQFQMLYKITALSPGCPASCTMNHLMTDNSKTSNRLQSNNGTIFLEMPQHQHNTSINDFGATINPWLLMLHCLHMAELILFSVI